LVRGAPHDESTDSVYERVEVEVLDRALSARVDRTVGPGDTTVAGHRKAGNNV
jgi:hypothetical protein